MALPVNIDDLINAPTTEARVRELAAYRHFDDRINTKASVDDFDLGLILSYLQEVKSQLYEEAQKMNLADLALKMQIARGSKENIKPLNVGLLMFSKEPHKYFDGCRTNLIELENEDGTMYAEKQFTGPVHVQIRQIMDYLNANVIKQFVQKNSSRAESDKFYNYPYQALEEAVVNALYHRSYENPTPNEIRIYKTGNDRRIEILSYPGPLPPVDEQALINLRITARNYRNIKLGDWLKNLRLAEKYATGIPTIISSLKHNGSPAPVLSMDAARSYFLVVFKIHRDTPVDANREVERIKLSGTQQSILERILKEPATEQELKQDLNADNSDIDFLIAKEFVGFKTIGSEKMFFITKPGIDHLS